MRDTEPYQDFFEKVKQVIQEIFPNSHVMLFGSSASYLAVQGSDIDVLVYDQSELFANLYNQSYDRLKKTPRFANC